MKSTLKQKFQALDRSIRDSDSGSLTITEASLVHADSEYVISGLSLEYSNLVLRHPGYNFGIVRDADTGEIKVTWIKAE